MTDSNENELSKRTATDVLLAVEARLISVEKRFQSVEFLLKALLGKLNKSPSLPPPEANVSPSSMRSDVINKDNFDNRPRTNVFAEMAANQGIRIEAPDELPNDMTESAVRAASRGQRGPKSKGPKVSVSQVLNRGSDPLFLANVEVLDSNKELVGQTRTNPKGRWLMALSPGNYLVHVTKRFAPESGKMSIDNSYQIKVSPSDKPLELDSVSMNE